MQSTTGTATAAVRVQRGLSLLPVASVSVSSTATTIETGLTNTAMQAGDSLLICFRNYRRKPAILNRVCAMTPRY